jgi:hypothetical protein
MVFFLICLEVYSVIYLFSFSGNNQWELLSTSFITGRYLTEPPTGWDELNKSLPKDVLSIQSKGKFIYFNLNNGTIWNTLGCISHHTHSLMKLRIYLLTFCHNRINWRLAI